MLVALLGLPSLVAMSASQTKRLFEYVFAAPVVHGIFVLSAELMHVLLYGLPD